MTPQEAAKVLNEAEKPLIEPPSEEKQRKLIQLKAQILKLEEEFDLLAQEFRDYADGETKSMGISGVGTITVTAPTVGTSSTVIEVVPEKLLDVPEKIKNDLFKKGVLVKTTKWGRSAKASVKVVPQK